MTESPFTVADLTEQRAKPDRFGFTYRVEHAPRRGPYALCRVGCLPSSSVMGTAPTVAEAMARLAEHVARLSEYCAVVSASVVANNR